MNLRTLRIYLALAFVFAFSSAALQAFENDRLDTGNDRPNIVFAFADDWGKHASVYAQLSPGGINDIVQTPNIDRIANQGVLFTNAFVNAPSCTPCRSSLFSGRNFWSTGRGAILHNATWDESIPTFPLLLEESGYHIGFSNKAWTPGTPADAPFGGKRNRYNKSGMRFNGFSQFLNKNRADVESAKQVLAEEVRGNFSNFLEQRDDKPFMYFWGPTNVHRKWIHDSGKDFWGLNADELKGKVPEFLPDVELIREDLADYLGEAQAFDFGIGVLMETLKSQGELDNTIIIISGDHGPPGFTNGKCSLYDFGCNVPLVIALPPTVVGNNKRVVDDVVCLPEIAPTILELCGVDRPEGMTAKSLVNILQASGSGKVDPEREFIVYGRERHVSQAREGFKTYPQRALRTGEFLFIRNFEPDRWPMGSPPTGAGDDDLPAFEKLRENTYAGWPDMDASPTKAWIAYNCREGEMRMYYEFAFGKRPARELYRIADDPDQIHNLADDPELASVAEALETKLMEYLEAHNDPRVTGDKMTFERPPFTGPFKRNQK